MAIEPAVSLNLDTGYLWQEQPRSLRPKILAVLHYLLDHAGQVISTATLRVAVWPGTVVSGGVVRNCIRELRLALGDDPATPRFIEQLPRKGYRLIGHISIQPRGTASQPKANGAPHEQPTSTVLVGREAELAALQGWLAKALMEARQLVFVTGEPGIGKTALVEAFAA
jgi:DNA-binding winged helix-turn-helix (wHTH) protein